MGKKVANKIGTAAIPVRRSPRSLLFGASCLSGMLLCLAPRSALAIDSGALRVGVAKVDITPTDLIVNGAGANPYEGVHDPIFARALVVSNGTETAALVTLDMIDFPATIQPLRDRIQREDGIAADHVIDTVSHDHSAPHFSIDWPACNGGNSGCSHPEQMKAYTQSTSDKIVEIVKQAKATLQPARLGLGTGSVDVNVNRDLYQAPKGWGMGANPTGIASWQTRAALSKGDTTRGKAECTSSHIHPRLHLV